MKSILNPVEPKKPWVFKPHTAAGDLVSYKPRRGDLIYSNESAYRLAWGDAISQSEPLRTVQIREVHGLNVRFVISEGFNGRLVEVGLHTLSEEDFLEFLRTGIIASHG